MLCGSWRGEGPEGAGALGAGPGGRWAWPEGRVPRSAEDLGLRGPPRGGVDPSPAPQAPSFEVSLTRPGPGPGHPCVFVLELPSALRA